MAVMRVLSGAIAILAGILYWTLDNSIYYTVFLGAMVFVWGFSAYDEWKNGRKYLAGLMIIVAVAVLIMFLDSDFVNAIL